MKIDKKWKLATSLIAALSANAVMSKIVTKALDGKCTVIDVIGGGLISGITGIAVGNEVLKLMNAVEEGITSEEEENTAEETEPTDEVAEES